MGDDQHNAISRDEYKRLLESLKRIEKNVQLTSALQVDRNAGRAKYPDLVSLSTFTQKAKIQCKTAYACEQCDVKRRNKCWAEFKKAVRRKQLIAGLPYTRNKLGDMQTSSLWMIASHLGLKPAKKGMTKGVLISDIINAQHGIRKGGKR